MTRYRVECDLTTTYRVTVEAATVEDAIEQAQQHVYPFHLSGYEVTNRRTVATDAQEIPE